MKDFITTTSRHIRVWIWVAIVLPISSLAGLFFVWRLAPDSWMDYAFIIGEVAMFITAVVWWCWAMWTMMRLIKQWDQTKDKVQEVAKDVKEIRVEVKKVLFGDK